MKNFTILTLMLFSLVTFSQANGDTMEDAIEIDGVGVNVNSALFNAATYSGLQPSCISAEDIFYKHISDSGDNFVTIGMVSAGTTAFTDINYQLFKAPSGDMSQLEELDCDSYEVVLLLGGSFVFEVEDENDENTYFLRVYKASVGGLDLATLLDNSVISMTSRFEQSLSNEDFDQDKFKMVVTSNAIELNNNSQFNNFKIYGLDGKVIQSQNNTSKIETININNLKSGLYIVHLVGDSSRYAAKFVKR